MGKQANRRAAARAAVRTTGDGTAVVALEDLPVVGMREPCPCGSGKRYKACHGKQAHRAAAASAPRRPFAGLRAEVDLVAMREIVSAATAPLPLVGERAGRTAEVVTLLPDGAAVVRADGTVQVAVQTLTAGSGDPSRDLAHVLLAALDAAPGTTVELDAVPPDGPRLQDLLDPESPLEVSVHDSFDFWGAHGGLDAGDAALLERANEAVVPAARLPGLAGAYWCRLADRDQVRWVLPHEEEPLLDALARLHARGEDGLGEATRLLGTFRAHGLLIPVWDLAAGTDATAVEEPAAGFAERLDAALAGVEPLTAAERGARAGLANRQVTVR